MRLLYIVLMMVSQSAFAEQKGTEALKREADSQIRQIIDPLLSQYCNEQCKVIHVESEVDLKVDELSAPGFEEGVGTAALAVSQAKSKILLDERMGQQSRSRLLNVIKEHLGQLSYPVQLEVKLAAFPEPATSAVKVAELKTRVIKEIKSSVSAILSQFCLEHCFLGDFEVQIESVNPEDAEIGSSQEYFIDGSAAVRVRAVRATVVTDQNMLPEDAEDVVEMVRRKVANFKLSEITHHRMKFPRLGAGGVPGSLSLIGRGSDAVKETRDAKELRDSKESRDMRELKDLKELRDAREMRESKELKNLVENETRRESQSTNDSRQENYSRFEKIERVENGDAVQQVLERFKTYGIILSAIMLALLMTLVAIAFRKNASEASATRESHPGKDNQGQARAHSVEDAASLTSEEKASLIGKRIEASRLFDELTGIYSEQPKVAKHVFTHVLTEEGVEVTAQYLEIFGESVVMDLLRDPGLQADLTELMDFYSRNTFDINDDEKLLLLKKLHHRTVTAKMQVHGSRSATLFDFLGEMDAPQVVEMVKNESNTVKAIVLTQCDQKRRQVIFHSYDDATKMKLMSELSRIDHLPKNYIYNVAAALRRKKLENPKLNTEALPGTDVLVSFLEKSSVSTQRSVIHQLMASSGADAIQNLKSKLVSLETLRYLKDQHLTEIITHVKHDELVQFLKGCGDDIRSVVLNRAPKDLAAELGDELVMAEAVSREAYGTVERKILNRIKMLANSGHLNLSEVNERIFADEFGYAEPAEVTTLDMKRVG